MMTDIVEVLRRSPLLGDLPDDMLERLAAGATPVELRPGEVLMHEGAPADAAYVVLEGLLEVTKRDGDADLLLDHCRPGDPVGELGLVHRRPRGATVRALEHCRLLRIDAQTFEDLLRAPGVARALLSSTTRRLEQRESVMRQHARMATLGSLTAGLLHQVNNPAAAVRRAAEQLDTAATDLEGASAELDPGMLQAVHAMAAGMSEGDAPAFAPTDGDVEEAIAERLEQSGATGPWQLAGRLAAAGVTPDDLDALAPAGDPRLVPAVRTLVARLEIPRLAASLREATGRISEVVDAVKGYSHHDRAPLQNISVNEGLEQALTLLAHRRRPGITVHRELADDLPLIEGYPGELNTVWTNLLENALDAVGERGELRVRTAAEVERVLVEVADDGPGIPEDIRDRIFDPFFTTKPVGQGTGLGLAVAHTVITQQHGGQLDLSSRPGNTTFTVRLPCKLPAGRA